MSIKRILAVIIIYMIAVVAWFILGSVMNYRSYGMQYELDQELRQLWGTPLIQNGPSLFLTKWNDKQKHVVLDASKIDVNLNLKHRRKGLIWYPTYACFFDAEYTVKNDSESSLSYMFNFLLPNNNGTYDGFTFQADGKDVDIPIDTEKGLNHSFTLSPGALTKIKVKYNSRGVHRWAYQINKDIGRVKDFNMQVATNFPNYDYMGGTMSADTAEDQGEGVVLRWVAEDRITQQNIGIEMPTKLNPGPLASQMTYFAPVCLIFFFSLIAAITIVKKIPIHPMHFLFVAAGFFAFHLLFAYLVDLLNVHMSFCLSAATTLFLVSGYMKAALKGAFPALAVIGGQLFFLVLFSYSFFLEGTTGLTVAIGSVITLAMIMRLTADVDWTAYFERKPKGIKASVDHDQQGRGDTNHPDLVVS